MMKESGMHDEMTNNLLPLIWKQLQAEYNVDLVSAHDAPQIGEIAEEGCGQILHSIW